MGDIRLAAIEIKDKCDGHKIWIVKLEQTKPVEQRSYIYKMRENLMSYR